MNNITVKVEPNQLKETIVITLSDLGISEQDWHNMDQHEKTSMLQEYIHELPEQPYWVVDKFNG